MTVRDQNTDVAGPYGNDHRAGALVGGTFAEPGRWSPPKPAYITAALLTRLTAMNIQEQGNSLIAQITSVRNDINNGTLDLACKDLEASVDHIQAQTGKAIGPVDAATILKWVEYISAGIPCTAK